MAVNNTGGDCHLLTPGIMISGNYNLESGTSCNFTQTFDLQNTDPLLNPLALNAPGTTATHSLQAASPAINRGFELGNITTDQRGVARAVQYDIGAYESDAAPFIDLSITKVGPNLAVNIGVDFQFNIRVTNHTIGTTATGVTVTDTLDPKLNFGTPTPAGCIISPDQRTITCVLPGVVGGSFQSVDIPVVGIQGGAIDNSASVAGDQIDPDLTNNTDTFTAAVNYPAPVITGLDPTFKMAKDPGFTLTVNGSDFADLAVVRWNGSDLLTTFVNAGQLTAQVPSGLLAVGVAAGITVFNPDPGGGLSNAVIFNVYNPVPTIDTVTPSQVLSGGFISTRITVTGSNYLEGARVIWNGTPLATTLFNSGLLQALVTPADKPAPAIVPVLVENPAPTQALSNTVNVTIVPGYYLLLPTAFQGSVTQP